MGKHIFFDCAMFDDFFGMNCSGFTTSFKNPWPSDFDVSIEDTKRAISLDNNDSLLFYLGTIHISFEVHVIAHIMATTLLPRAGSLSTHSLNDIFLTFLHCYSA